MVLAYGTSQLSAPVILTEKEEKQLKAEQYATLLNCRGQQLPNPFLDLERHSWLGEKNGVEKWPPILLKLKQQKPVFELVFLYPCLYNFQRASVFLRHGHHVVVWCFTEEIFFLRISFSDLVLV